MKVVILCGIPGSGKSTFRNKHSAFHYVSQDELGSRSKCLELFRRYLKEEKNVIVDRCNINKLQRSLWIKEAQKAGVKDINCVYFQVDPEIAIKRITERKGHETIKENSSLEKNQEIVYSFINTFEIPELSEGFKMVLMMDKNED